MVARATASIRANLGRKELTDRTLGGSESLQGWRNGFSDWGTGCDEGSHGPKWATEPQTGRRLLFLLAGRRSPPSTSHVFLRILKGSSRRLPSKLCGWGRPGIREHDLDAGPWGGEATSNSY